MKPQALILVGKKKDKGKAQQKMDVEKYQYKIALEQHNILVFKTYFV